MTDSEFVKELSSLLNRACRENGSSTPDYMLAEFLMGVLSAYDTVVVKRDEWWGLKPAFKASGTTEIDDGFRAWSRTLSVRAQNTLHWAKLTTFDAVRAKGPEGLSRIGGCGRATVREIWAALDEKVMGP